MTKKKDVTNPMCHAHKRSTGEPCGNRALNGMTVCRFHGGATRSSRDAAQRRILAAADPAVETIVNLMFDKAAPHAVRLNAARDLLDRANLSGRATVEVEVGIDPELMAMVMEARDEARTRLAPHAVLTAASAAADHMDDVIDAELADDYDQDGYIDLEFAGSGEADAS